MHYVFFFKQAGVGRIVSSRSGVNPLLKHEEFIPNVSCTPSTSHLCISSLKLWNQILAAYIQLNKRRSFLPASNPGNRRFPIPKGLREYSSKSSPRLRFLNLKVPSATSGKFYAYLDLQVRRNNVSVSSIEGYTFFTAEALGSKATQFYYELAPSVDAWKSSLSSGCIGSSAY